jgi:DNA-binding NarL/FixJ family response regulator
MNRPRVLLADDNELLAKRVAEHLALSCDVVGIAHDGRDLIAKALRLAPDVIVADITMPILTGVEAAHQLREDRLAARFVFLTNHREDEFVQACFEEGAMGYVVKFHINADLIAAIHSAMVGKLFVSPSLSFNCSEQAVALKDPGRGR